MKNVGADFLVGNSGPKEAKPQKKLADGIVVSKEEIEEVLAQTNAAGKRLGEGLKTIVAGLDAVRTYGLTGEALVVLVTAKCPLAANGKPISEDTVKRVLETLFNRLHEYTR